MFQNISGEYILDLIKPSGFPHLVQNLVFFFQSSSDQPLLRVCAVGESTRKRPTLKSVNRPLFSCSKLLVPTVSPEIDS